MRRLRPLVDGQSRIEAVVIAVHLPDPLGTAIAPVARLVLNPAMRGASVSRVAAQAGSGGKTNLVEETLADLVDGDELFEAGGADVYPRGAAETERRVAGHHVGICVPRAEACRDVERRAIRKVLLHPCEVRSDPHCGDQRARVLTAGSLQRNTARRERGFAQRGVEHAANLGIARVTAAGQDHGPAGTDVHGFSPLIDIAVLPEAAQKLARLRVLARRIVGFDSENPAGEGLLAYELVETAVQDELDAFLARRELERPREGHAVAQRVRRGETARVCHLHGCERARALGIGDARILRADRSRLDVGLLAADEETRRAPRARQASAAVRAVDAREPDIVVHQELPRGRAVLGPSAHELPLVVSVRALASAVEDRPVGDVGEQELDAVVELLGILDWRLP